MDLIGLVASLIAIVGFNAFLFFGVHCMNRCMVMFWMVLDMLGIIVHFMGGIGLLMVGGIGSAFSAEVAKLDCNGEDAGDPDMPCVNLAGDGVKPIKIFSHYTTVFGIWLIVWACISIYFWVVVHSLKDKMYEQRIVGIMAKHTNPLFTREYQNRLPTVY